MAPPNQNQDQNKAQPELGTILEAFLENADTSITVCLAELPR